MSRPDTLQVADRYQIVVCKNKANGTAIFDCFI